jgi:LuxR family maltose regulon positive regulatory protein
MAGRTARRLVASKLAPMPDHAATVRRARLDAVLSEGRPVTLLSAMSGYGKTTAVRHWFEQAHQNVGWTNIDRLDAEPAVFWAHFVAALSTACPEIDDEPALLLQERGGADRVFLAVLVSEISAASAPVTVVLDGLDQIVDRQTIDDVALVVDRCHERLRLVITTQVDPSLPLGRWRRLGWLRELREDDLRLLDDEAVEIGRLRDGPTDDEAVRRLNHLVDGWPLAFGLALVSDRLPGDRSVGLLAGDKSIAAQLTGQLLVRMDDEDRDVALALSVFEEFDPAIAMDVLGAERSSSVRRLVEHGVLLTVVDARVGTMRLRPLIRELLEAELGWRDPVGRVELHRRAAAVRKERGELRSAYRHLAAIGETARARELLVNAAFDIVDLGDLRALRDLADQLPAPAGVDDARLALELGLVAAWGDGPVAASRWCDRVDELGRGANDTGGAGDVNESIDAGRARPSEPPSRSAISSDPLRAMVAALDGDLREACRLAERMPEQLPRHVDRIDLAVAFPVARALVAARHPLARTWIDRLRVEDAPPIVVNVTVPTLVSWHEWVSGRLDVASELSERAVTWLSDRRIDAHHWAFDTFITAGWCRLSTYDLAGAREMAERAEHDAALLPGRWNRLQAAFLMSRLLLAEGDAAAALRMLDDLRASIPFETVRPYADRLVHLAAEASIAIGRIDQASVLAGELSPGIHRQLVRARIEPLSDQRLEAELADRATWPVSARLQAEVILATRAPSSEPPPRFIDVVRECGESGWVLPFLGLGPRAERTLRSMPLDDLHPALAAAMRPEVEQWSLPSDETARLTPREQTVLELLPTHLSYAELGEQMFLSVNTVKSTLKGLYRKLDAHTRAEAVAAGRAAGLI